MPGSAAVMRGKGGVKGGGVVIGAGTGCVGAWVRGSVGAWLRGGRSYYLVSAAGMMMM